MAPVFDILGTLVRREEEQFDATTCTWETCSLDLSWYSYRPSLAVNGFFAGIFGISVLVYIAQGIRSRMWMSFTIAMVLGCITEAIGYVGRILMWNDPWGQDPFAMQMAALTFAPAFLAAGIYFTLSRIVLAFGRENSRLPALWYPRIFIPCDILSLALQAGGGGISSGATDKSGSDMGRNVMVVGLVLQVVVMSAFIGLATDFAVRTRRRTRTMGGTALDASQAALRTSFKFRSFLMSLITATILIYIRCVYRVAELSEGWDGPLMKKEGLFIALEGIVLAISVIGLCVFSPTRCFESSHNKNSDYELAGGQRRSGEELLNTPTPPKHRSQI